MGGLDAGAFALVFTAVLLGSTVQAVVGLGIGLIAAPVITLVAPELMPGVLIALAFVLPCVTLVHDHDDIDWHGLNWSLPSRLVGTVGTVGTVGGVWVVATFTADQLGALIGAIVLVAVAVTWRAVTVPINRGTLSAAAISLVRPAGLAISAASALALVVRSLL